MCSLKILQNVRCIKYGGNFILHCKKDEIKLRRKDWGALRLPYTCSRDRGLLLSNLQTENKAGWYKNEKKLGDIEDRWRGKIMSINFNVQTMGFTNERTEFAQLPILRPCSRRDIFYVWDMYCTLHKPLYSLEILIKIYDVTIRAV